MRLWGVADEATLTLWIRQNALRLLANEVESDFRRWLVGELLPDTSSTVAWTLRRLELISADAVVARRCYDGDLTACSIALELTPVADPITQFFDADGRRRLVERSEWAARQLDRPASDRCIAGVDAACIANLREWSRLEAVPREHRLALAKLAIQLGGPAGYERILTTSGTPAQRIASAAGLPIDTVLRMWQRKVRETTVPSQDMSLGIAAGSLIWILACGALSLRSSRWR